MVRGLRPANGILQRHWTLQHSRMQWSRFIWIMLVIWYFYDLLSIFSFYCLFCDECVTMCPNLKVWIHDILSVDQWRCLLWMQELIAKCIESSDLNFSRYGDTFFEVGFLPLADPYVVFLISKPKV